MYLEKFLNKVIPQVIQIIYHEESALSISIMAPTHTYTAGTDRYLGRKWHSGVILCIDEL